LNSAREEEDWEQSELFRFSCETFDEYVQRRRGSDAEALNAASDMAESKCSASLNGRTGKY